MPELDFRALQNRVIDWGESKGILDPKNGTNQCLYIQSEAGELAGAHLKKDQEGIVDGVGDTLVTIINYCACQGIDPLVCLERALREIEGRTGQTVGGVFVKDG